jgi:23S rRNA U2552 (ribose-2'-O)-methylase RlmE/FtsJ
MKVYDLLLNYKTDKNLGVIDPNMGHFYGESYDEIFSWFNKKNNLNILEIGVQKGGSLKAWRDFFPNATITGVDILDVREKEYISSDLKFIQSDIKKVNIDENFKESGLDIIIDDGSHFLEDVLFVVNNYLDVLNNDGVLIIEDVQEPEKWFADILLIVMHKLNCFEIQYRDMRKVGHYDDFLIIIRKRNYKNISRKYIKLKNIVTFKYLKNKDYLLKKIIRKIFKI